MNYGSFQSGTEQGLHRNEQPPPTQQGAFPRLTVEETNLLSIYNEGGKRALIENVNAALPYMDADMRELAKRTLSKVDALTEAEFAELPIYAADEV